MTPAALFEFLSTLGVDPALSAWSVGFAVMGPMGQMYLTRRGEEYLEGLEA